MQRYRVERKKQMKSLIIQFVKFFGISGIGWCIDFMLYLFITLILGWPVFYSNYLSSIPAVTLVFFVSTKKIFNNHKGRLPIWAKYFIYVVYQMLLLLCVSSIGQAVAEWITNLAVDIVWMQKAAKIVAKILITPITMLMNFIVMKIMTEKL